MSTATVSSGVDIEQGVDLDLAVLKEGLTRRWQTRLPFLSDETVTGSGGLTYCHRPESRGCSVKARNRMKTKFISLALTCSLVSPLVLCAADPSPKDALLAAAKKLGDQPNYSWKTTVEVPENTQFKPGPTEGKTEKDGFTCVTMSFGDQLTEMVVKGDQAVVTDQDGNWQTAADLETAEGRGRFLGRMAKNFKTPAAQAGELIGAAKEFKVDGGVYSADLTEEGAKKQFRFGQPKDPKGSVKFWVKDGVFSKMEVKVSAMMEFNGNEFDATRTTTMDIQKVGDTKVNVPADAKKKLK